MGAIGGPPNAAPIWLNAGSIMGLGCMDEFIGWACECPEIVVGS